MKMRMGGHLVVLLAVGSAWAQDQEQAAPAPEAAAAEAVRGAAEAREAAAEAREVTAEVRDTARQVIEAVNQVNHRAGGGPLKMACPTATTAVPIDTVQDIEALTNEQMRCVTFDVLASLWRRSDLIQAFNKDQLAHLPLTDAQIRGTGVDYRLFAPVDLDVRNGLATLQRSLRALPTGIRLLGDGYAQLSEAGSDASTQGAFGLGSELEVPSNTWPSVTFLAQILIRKGSEASVLSTPKVRGASILSPQTQDTSFIGDFKVLGMGTGFQWGGGARLEAAAVDWGFDAGNAAVTTLAFTPAPMMRWLWAGNDNLVDIRAQLGFPIRSYHVDAADEALVGKAALGSGDHWYFGIEPRVTLRINAVEVGMMLPWHPQDGAAGVSGLHFVPFISLQPGAQLVTF